MTAIATRQQQTTTTQQPPQHKPQAGLTVPEMAQRMIALTELRNGVLREGVDYGVIPGTTKPTLLQPGAQKLAIYYGLRPEFSIDSEIEDWTGEDHGGEPLFRYRVRCTLYNEAGNVAGDALGDVNSWETRYRTRWVSEQDVPDDLDRSRLEKRVSYTEEYDFAVSKAEVSGKYGKPPEYWEMFRQAIKDGTAEVVMKQSKSGKTLKAYRIPSVEYAIPNRRIHDLVNTLIKIAEKRAFVASVITATGASEFFTQDMEDYADHVSEVFAISRTATARQAPVMGSSQDSAGEEAANDAAQREAQLNPGMATPSQPASQRQAPTPTDEAVNWRTGEAAQMIPALRQATNINNTADLFDALEAAGSAINPSMTPERIAEVLQGRNTPNAQPRRQAPAEPEPESQAEEPLYYKNRRQPIADLLQLHAQVASLAPASWTGKATGKQATSIALLVAQALPDQEADAQDDARHALCQFFFDKDGVTGENGLSKAEASAVIDILTDEDGNLHPCAESEVKAVVEYMANEAADPDDIENPEE